MAMPDYSGAWPPAPHSEALDAYQLWGAWFEGNTSALERLYQQWPQGVPVRASQYAAGFIGRLARFWWGRPPMQATKRLHVPAAADVARTSADLLFGQPPQWVLNEGDAKNLEAAQDRLNHLLESSDSVATLLEAAELQSALGGVYLRLWWDRDVTDKVMLGAVAPDCAVPEWRYGKLSAVTFWTVVCDDKSGVWRHLERHEPGAIYHALYKGDSSDIGRLMPLKEQEATAWAADLVDENSSIPTRVSGLTAAYVPNVRPSRKWRNVPGLSPLGRSDFEGLEQLFDQLDEAYSSWMRDLDLGKARLFVSADMMEDAGPGRGSMWDPEQAIFTPIPGGDLGSYSGDAPKAGDLIHSEQFAIRHAEHQATCQALLARILSGAGYSVGDFGDDQLASAITATEVVARKDLSNRTRARKIGYWKSSIEPLARTMLELDAVIYGGDYGIQADPEMQFPARADQSPMQLSQTILNLSQAEGISTETKVRMFNPGWSSDEIEDEVERILEEKQMQVPNTLPGEFGDTTSTGGDTMSAEDPHSDLQGDAGTEPPAEEDDTGNVVQAA
ncbi:phage portal protein [Nocardia elegans]|uniref:Phage portal protein n=1 Tax=Nocardia elegans TaxID=300029 RepID=A0ABW6TP28_9NOCA